jgi:hypothetical protein
MIDGAAASLPAWGPSQNFFKTNHCSITKIWILFELALKGQQAIIAYSSVLL